MLGGLIAALIAKFLLNGENIELAVNPQYVVEKDGDFDYKITASMISEFVGSFVFIFLFMLCTDKKTQYSDDKVINCFIMSSAHVSARLMAGGAFVAHLTAYIETEVDGEVVKTAIS